MILDAEEVSGAEWHDPMTVDPEEIAFPSMRRALAAYCAAITRRGERPGA
jgi:hypothetical protein